MINISFGRIPMDAPPDVLLQRVGEGAMIHGRIAWSFIPLRLRWFSYPVWGHLFGRLRSRRAFFSTFVFKVGVRVGGSLFVIRIMPW